MTKKNYNKLVEIINNNKELIYVKDYEPLKRIDFLGFIYNLAQYLKEDNPPYGHLLEV